MHVNRMIPRRIAIMVNAPFARSGRRRGTGGWRCACALLAGETHAESGEVQHLGLACPCRHDVQVIARVPPGHLYSHESGQIDLDALDDVLHGALAKGERSLRDEERDAPVPAL